LKEGTNLPYGTLVWWNTGACQWRNWRRGRQLPLATQMRAPFGNGPLLEMGSL